VFVLIPVIVMEGIYFHAEKDKVVVLVEKRKGEK
jgi:hypothetical protein